MKKYFRNISSFIFAALFLLNFSIGAMAADKADIDNVIDDVTKYIYETVKEPRIGQVGGEWAIIGLARSGVEIPDEYYMSYYNAVTDEITAKDGVISTNKYSDYSRVIIALTAIGKNPADVAGYNLLTPLGDYEKTVYQGLNGPIWALIALDSGNYEMPPCSGANVQATREMYINYILDSQISMGGWSLGENDADADITAMAITALSKYQDNEKVKSAVEKAVSCLMTLQNMSGGFSSRDGENSESAAQVIMALCEAGISPENTGFVKNGKTLVDNLLMYYEKGNGFKHTQSDGRNQMATEQCLCSLVMEKRYMEGKNGLYDMSDAIDISENEQILGLSGKNADVKKQDIVSIGRTFSDIKSHENQKAIEELAARNIINGKSEDIFEPESTMTRAEFATITVRSLGLPIKGDMVFSDVTAADWYFDYIRTAYDYGIVSGISADEFNPNGTITREEAAVMTARAAKLCGLDTDMEISGARDILAVFSDYVKASDWAMTSLAFCYDKKILPDDAMEINPKNQVTRAQIAQMLFNTLSISKLL